MKKSHRYITSLLLTTIYLLIVFIPLAPVAMQSKLVAHAVTGECSGDCKIDGCSLERSATHTCCCWQRKQRENSEIHQHSSAGCCGTPQASRAEGRKHGASCCVLPTQDSHENCDKLKSVSSAAPQKKSTTTVSSRRCGGGKIFALLNVESTHHLPFFYIGKIRSPTQNNLTFTPPVRLTSRHGDPPDPPPIIS